MYSLQTEKLSYSFSKKSRVLDDLDLKVPKGSIYGFLGQNGAGKTTAIKLMAGLLTGQQGAIRIFGQSLHDDRVGILKNTGYLIEAPCMYAHLSAYENLQVLQKAFRFTNERILEVLQMVGLSNAGNKKAGKFSLGMKQRLGIAMALVHDPGLLILDEPTNGLDPNGIVDIRELLIKLNREHGVTIFISSHLLAEIEKLVTDIGIIHKGVLKFQGPLSELLLRRFDNETVFETSDPTLTIALFLAKKFKARMLKESVAVQLTDKESISELIGELFKAGIQIYQVRSVNSDLESIFLEIINT